MSDHNQSDMSSSFLYNLLSDQPVPSQRLNLPTFDQGGEVHILRTHPPRQQHVTMLQVPQQFPSRNAHVSSDQTGNNAQLRLFGQGPNDVSRICQNVSANLHQLESQNLQLSSDLDQARAVNNQLGRENEKLTQELGQACNFISSLQATNSKNQEDNRSLQLKLTRARSSSTSIKRELNETTTKFESVSSQLACATQEKSFFESRIFQLNTIIAIKSRENAQLNQDLKTLKMSRKSKEVEAKSAESKLKDAQSKISDLERENMRLSNELNKIIEEESRRQTLYEKSFISKLVRENKEDERKTEKTRKRKVGALDDGEHSNKKRNEDVTSTVCVDQQNNEEVRTSSVNSPTNPHSQNIMLENRDEVSEEEGDGDANLYIAE